MRLCRKQPTSSFAERTKRKSDQFFQGSKASWLIAMGDTMMRRFATAAVGKCRQESPGLFRHSLANHGAEAVSAPVAALRQLV